MSTALIIEDDEWAITILRLQLESFGFAVETSRLAEDGLRRTAQRRPEVILLDLMLPGMGGWEALQRLKADARLAELDLLGPALEHIVTRARREIGEGSWPAAAADRRTQCFPDRDSEE